MHCLSLLIYWYTHNRRGARAYVQLRFGSTRVWDPHHHTDIKKLESVQKFAGKIVTKQWRAEYPDLLASLNWKPLSSRRKNQKLKVCFNILNNLSIISPNVLPPVTLIIKLF